MKSISIRLASAVLALNVCILGPLGHGITINVEYTDEGDPIPHDENPSWDPSGLILKKHFAAAKAIWEALLPGPGTFDFDFHWDDDIDGLGLYTTGIDDYIEIHPSPTTASGALISWFADPTPETNAEFNTGTQKLYSGLSATEQSTFFPGTSPPSALEVGFLSSGKPNGGRLITDPSNTLSASGQNLPGTMTPVDASNGYDLLSTIVHEMGHALGINGTEPGEYNILPQHVGGLDNVLVLEDDDSGHLAGGPMPPGSSNLVPGFLMSEGSAVSGFRRFPTATDVLVIAEDQGITDVHLARVGSIGSGLWSDASRWLGDSSPGITQAAYISHGGAISLDMSPLVPELRVDNGSSVLVNDKRLDVIGELDVRGGNASVQAGGTIAASKINRGVGVLSTAPGSLVQFNELQAPVSATVNFHGSVEIGYGAPNAQVPIAMPAANSTWNIAEQLSVGVGGRSAELRIASGADVTSASARLGMNTVTSSSSAGSVRVDGDGSTWNVGPLQVRNGELMAINSGRVNSGAAGVGREGGLGRVAIDNGQWDVDGDLVVGAATIFADASGTVAVRNGGEINVDGNVDVRGTPTRLSEISVRSAGSLNVEGEVAVGPYAVVSYYNNVVANGPFIGATTFKSLGAAADSGAGGVIRFYDDASAGNGQFTNQAATTFFGTGGSTEFRGSASAGNGEFHNLPGGTVSRYSGTTRFFDFATAGAGEFYNQPGRWTIPPTVEFNGDSSGGEGTFVNLPGVLGASLGGAFVFNDRAKAGTGTYANQGEGGNVVFNDFSSAEDGMFTTADTIGSGNSRISFYEDSTAKDATFNMGAGTALDFLTRSSAGDATITLRRGSTASFSGEFNLPRLPTVTAGTADIAVQGSSIPGAYGGFLGFSTYSTAGDAVIDTHGGAVAGALGGTTRFDYEGRAGNATLITHGPGVAGAGGGATEFARGANGDNARVITHAGGVFNIAGNFGSNVTTVGSIEGAGTYVLGGAELQTGSRNSDTTVSGQLVDPLGLNPHGKLTKVGTGTLTLAGANTYTGATTINGGAINLSGSLAGGAVVNNGGTLKGTGAIAGSVAVNVGGVFAPGASPGATTVGGLTMAPGGILKFELGGPAYDHIVLTNNGNVLLDGILDISFLPGFIPTLGQSFPMFEGSIGSIIGAFDSVTAPTINGLTVYVVQNASSVVLQVGMSPGLSADFDSDGDVDGQDLAKWRGDFGLNALSDADDDGDSDGADFLIWQRQNGIASLADVSTTVPEPSNQFVALLAGSLIHITSRRRYALLHG